MDKRISTLFFTLIIVLAISVFAYDFSKTNPAEGQILNPPADSGDGEITIPGPDSEPGSGECTLSGWAWGAAPVSE